MYVQNLSKKPRTIDDLLGINQSPEAQAQIERSLKTLEQPARRESATRAPGDGRPMTLDDLRRRPTTGFTEALPPRSYRTVDDILPQQDKQIPQKPWKTPDRTRNHTRTLFDLTNDPMNGSRFLAALEGPARKDRVVYGTVSELLNTPGNPFGPVRKQGVLYPNAVLPVPPVVPKDKPSSGTPTKEKLKHVEGTINYAVVLDGLRKKVDEKGQEWDLAIPRFQESLRAYNNAARTFSDRIRRIQSGLSPRGKALLKRDIEELQGFKQVVQNTMKNFHINLTAAR